MSKSACAAIAWMVVFGSCRAAFSEPESTPHSTEVPVPEVRVLDLRTVLSMVRRESPGPRIARARITEAVGRRAQAEIFPRENPVVDLSVGPRLLGTDPESVVLSVGLAQSFDLGGGTAARVQKVDAEVRAAKADAENEELNVIAAASQTFARAVWADECVRLAKDASALTRTVLDATDKRFRAGDATALELNLAKGGLARAIADERMQETARAQALGELAILVGLPREGIVVKGELTEVIPLNREALRAAATQHPELKVLRAEREGANAEMDLADALGYPTLGVGARYEHEDQNVHTILGTLSLTLPFFERGQGVAAEARARRDRIDTELTARQTARTRGIEGLIAIAEGRRGAARAFEMEGGVASFRENLRLATKGYEAGETSLVEMLSFRRELIETERDRLDRLLEATLAEIDAAAAAGVIQ
jgi:outer membrane protein TolC